MRFKEDIYITAKQCLKGVLLAFIAVGAFIALHQIIWDWICASASFIFYGAGDVLVFIFPVLPATCFVLIGFIVWLSCLTQKLSNMNKLTIDFWIKARNTHIASLLLLIGVFSAWLSISNSGPTMLKGAAIIGFLISIMATMIIACAYDDQKTKPEDKLDEELA